MSRSPFRKKIPRRDFLALIGSATAGVALASCAPQVTSAPTPQPVEPTKAPAPTTAPEKAAAALKVWADTAFVPAMQKMSEGFTQKYGVQIDFNPMGFGDILNQFQQAGPAGEGPDLIDMNVDWLDPLSRAGLLAPIDYGDKLDKIDPRAVTGWSLAGKMYALPLAMESYGMYRNPDLLDQPLKNWNDLEAVVDDLKEKDVEFPILFENQSYVDYGLITAFGGYLFGTNADGSYNNQDVGLDNAGTLKYARWVDSMVKKGIFKPGQDNNTCETLWTGGKSALYPSGPWHIQNFKTAGIKIQIDILPEADKEANPFLSVRAFGLNKLGKQLALASTYLTEYLAADEPQKIFSDITAKESPWLPVKDKTTDVLIKQQIEAAKNGMPIPSVPGVMSYWNAMTDATALILNQQGDPEEAFKNLAAKVREGVKSAAG
ncbi:MAG: extracellular solute-binding protein [Chloroflexi bacterium]|nr:extracellular solute-binding protein [Chloroflexota bacterium]